MTLVIGALTLGLILSLVGLGVYISSRIINFRDLTVDGAMTFGAAVTSVLLVRGVPPIPATLGGFAAGFVAGAVTGVIATKLGVNGLVAGILVMTGLFSVNLHVMGKSNISLSQATTIGTYADRAGRAVTGDVTTLYLLGWPVGPGDLAWLALAAVAAVLSAVALYAFFRTDYGQAMRAAGDNEQMIRALGVDVSNVTIVALAVSNGLIGLAGALYAQYQGFTDVQMGIGMLVFGIASVILGEALTATKQVGLMIAGTVLGAVFFRLLIAIALRAGLDPNDLKLTYALFVLAALVAPDVLGRLRKSLAKRKHA